MMRVAHLGDRCMVLEEERGEACGSPGGQVYGAGGRER